MGQKSGITQVIPLKAKKNGSFELIPYKMTI